MFISKFQVLDSSGELIWEYAPNADGSPGDKWVLRIYHPTSDTSRYPDTLAMGAVPPFVSIRRDPNGDCLVDFCGALEQSTDLSEWTPVGGQVFSPHRIPSPLAPQQFFRAYAP